MQTKDFEPKLEGAVAEVLEAMCFLSPLGDATGQPAAEEERLCGRLSFTGAFSGRFGVAAPLMTARSIAANFLGEDELSLTHAQTEEVMRELANMVCGALLGSVELKRTFSLSPPSSIPDTETPSPHRLSKTFELDEGTLDVWLEIRSEP